MLFTSSITSLFYIYNSIMSSWCSYFSLSMLYLNCSCDIIRNQHRSFIRWKTDSFMNCSHYEILCSWSCLLGTIYLNLLLTYKAWDVEYSTGIWLQLIHITSNEEVFIVQFWQKLGAWLRATTSKKWGSSGLSEKKNIWNNWAIFVFWFNEERERER